jgi:hypothetical protein
VAVALIARIWYSEGYETDRIIVKPHWVYDNFYETGTAPLKEEAIKAAKDRWGVPEVYEVIDFNSDKVVGIH